MILLIVGTAACSVASTHNSTGSAQHIQSIYWSDGDSGRIDGKRFRLANVDAPETGGVNARGGARCERERVLGYKAKEFVVQMTRNADLQITRVYGTDRYARQVIDLSANGSDVASSAMAEGHLAPWPHMGQRSLAPKPEWCPIR